MDISMLVDPMVQNYIYENGLYLRAPQFKNILAPQELHFEWCRGVPKFLRDEVRTFARTHWLPNRVMPTWPRAALETDFTDWGPAQALAPGRRHP